MAKLILGQVTKAYAVATASLFATSAIGGYIWENYDDLNKYTATLGFGALYISASALVKSVKRGEREIGHRSSPSISTPRNSRAIPVHHAGGTTNLFTYTLDLIGQSPKPEADEIEIPSLFMVENLTVPGCDDPQNITLNEGLISTFVYTSYRRQEQRKPPFSRNWWLRQRHPRLDKVEYFALIHLLDDFNLIVNRRQGRSGQLALQPQRAIKHLKMAYGLQN